MQHLIISVRAKDREKKNVMKKLITMMMMLTMSYKDDDDDDDEDIYQRLCLHTRHTAQTCSQMTLSGPSLGLSSVHPSVAPASDCVVVPTQKTEFLQLP